MNTSFEKNQIAFNYGPELESIWLFYAIVHLCIKNNKAESVKNVIDSVDKIYE